MQPSLSQDHEGNKAVCKVIDKCICNVTNKLDWRIHGQSDPPNKDIHTFLDLFICTHHLLTVHIMFHKRFLSHLCCVFPCLSPRPHDPGPSSCIRLHQSINPLEAFSHVSPEKNIWPYSRGLPRVHGLRVVFISPLKKAGDETWETPGIFGGWKGPFRFSIETSLKRVLSPFTPPVQTNIALWVYLVLASWHFITGLSPKHMRETTQ